jgi:hypothetical protein
MQKENSGQTPESRETDAGENENQRQKKGGASGRESNEGSTPELGSVSIADNLPKGDPDKGSHRLQ